MLFFPQAARPALIDTKFCSAIPTSTNCSALSLAKDANDAEPRESLHKTTISLSLFDSSNNTSQMTCLLAIFIHI